MKARIRNPAVTIPGGYTALEMLGASVHGAGVPEVTLQLVQLRASQINGCSLCVDLHSRALEQSGEPRARIFTVSAWREATYFTDAERAALALTEAATRLADRPDAVPDDVWNEAARHYDESQLAVLVFSIATINLWNRLTVTTRQIGQELPARVTEQGS